MWIIGDVHGCYKTLMALIDKLPKGAKLCFVGDLIDRGPNSAQVVEFVKSNNHDCVLGNHERMMLDYEPPGAYGSDSIWIRNGAFETWASYNDNDWYSEHLKWMELLPYYLEYPDLVRGGRHLVVSHSSFAKTYRKYSFNTIPKDEDILWNRDICSNTLQSSNPFYNVFGHTVQPKPRIEDYFACIDTGAVFKDHKQYGNLTALHFPSLEVVQQENIED